MDNKTSINIRELENGFLVNIYVTNGSDPFTSGEAKEFYCVDVNQICTRIKQAFGETDNG